MSKRKQKERPVKVRREDGILVDTTLEDLCYKLNITCFSDDDKCIATILSGYKRMLSKLTRRVRYGITHPEIIKFGDYFTKEQVFDIITLSMLKLKMSAIVSYEEGIFKFGFKPTYKLKDNFKTTWKDFYLEFFELEKNIWTDAVLDYIEADSYFSSIAAATSPYEMVHEMVELFFETVDTLNNPQSVIDEQEAIERLSLISDTSTLLHLGRYASVDNTYTGYIDTYHNSFALFADREDNIIPINPALKTPHRIAKLLDLPRYKSGYGLILLNFIKNYGITKNTTDEEIKECVKNFENHRENLKSSFIDSDTQDTIKIAYAYNDIK